MPVATFSERLKVSDAAVYGMDTELYAVDQHVETPRGNGFRIHTLEDEVYELLETGDGASRIHPSDRYGGDQWRSTVQLPVAEVQEAYDTFRAVADRVEEAYDVDLPESWISFRKAYENGGTSVGHDAFNVRYNREDGITVPKERFATYGGVGTLGGGFFGSLAGMFGSMGAHAAGLVSEPTGVAIMLGSIPASFIFGWGGGYLGPKAKGKWTNWRRQRTYGDPEKAGDDTLFARLNERNSLEALLNGDESFPDHLTDRYLAMEDAGLEDVKDLLLKTHFHGFDKAQGVVAEATFDTYEEAAEFQHVVRGDTAAVVDRASIYTNTDAFTTMFDHLTFTVEGEEYILTDAERVVENVYERDTHPDIVTWLEEEHPDLVTETGQRHTLDG